MHRRITQALVVAAGWALLNVAAWADPVLDQMKRNEAARDRDRKESEASAARQRGEQMKRDRKEREEEMREVEVRGKIAEEWLRANERKKERERLEADPAWQAEQRKKAEARQRELDQIAEAAREREAAYQKRLWDDPKFAQAEMDWALQRADAGDPALHADLFKLVSLDIVRLRGNEDARYGADHYQLKSDAYYGLGELHRQALSLLYVLADMKYPEAEYRLGKVYASGKLGRSPYIVDQYEAARWFQAAADHRHGLARIELGRLYSLGEGGLPKDPAQAAFGMIRGLPLSYLGSMPRQDERFIRTLRSQPTVLARTFALLGESYANDVDDEKFHSNPRQAYILYALAGDLAADPHYRAARDALGEKLRPEHLGDSLHLIGAAWLGGTFSRLEFGRNLSLARDHFLAGARLGNLPCQFELARYLAIGGWFEDPEEAISAYAWYAIWLEGQKEPAESARNDGEACRRKLTKKQLARAQFRVGKFFASELKAPQPEVAGKWFKLASENGYEGNP